MLCCAWWAVTASQAQDLSPRAYVITPNHAHAVTLSGYMGKSDAFDQAIAAFSMAYADQNESDHAALDRGVREGKVQAIFEEER